ncbi:MAG: hypothetical protein ACD_24C00274G0001 [uncultured bacterium]|nr:MAG: hypothetical protein ACD_24C00274G0001 [uncultured bacterium]
MSKSCCDKTSGKELKGILKPLLFIAVVPTVVVAGVIFLISKSQSTAAVDRSEIDVSDTTYKVDKNSFSFGTVSMRDGIVETVYELTNTGSEDIFVKELFTSCMCTKAQLILSDGTQTGFYGMKGHGGLNDFYVGKLIKAGETVSVKAVFDPNAHGPQGTGFIKRNIILSTNLKSNPNIQFSFDAEVIK